MSNWLLRIWEFIRGLFRGKRLEVAPDVAGLDIVPPVPKRVVYPDMPQHQPCPVCGGWRRRLNKSLGGAVYQCWHGYYFVRR